MSKNSRRIPRAEAETIVGRLAQHLDGAGYRADRWAVGGSYRWRSAEVGDLDVIVDGRDYGAFIHAIAPMIPRGSDIVIRKKDGAIIAFYVEGTRIEFYVTSQANAATEWGAMVLFVGGSGDWNIKCRNAAIAKGMKLNEKGVWVPEVQATPKEKNKVVFKDATYPCLVRDGGWVKIAGRTEEECLNAIGYPNTPVEERI